jgi:hypothetical protein
MNKKLISLCATTLAIITQQCSGMMLIKSINKYPGNKIFLSRQYCQGISQADLLMLKTTTHNNQEMISLLKQIAENQKQFLTQQEKTHGLLKGLYREHKRHMNSHGVYYNYKLEE